MKYFISSFVIFFLTPLFFVSASYPLNLEFFSYSMSGNSTTSAVVYDGRDNYIYAVSLQQSKDLSTTKIMCGDTVIAENYGKDYSQSNVMYNCGDDDVVIFKTGNDEAFITILMLRDEPLDIISSSTVKIEDGDMLISFLILLGLFLALIQLVYNTFSGVEITKKIKSNNTVDGKEEKIL